MPTYNFWSTLTTFLSTSLFISVGKNALINIKRWTLQAGILAIRFYNFAFSIHIWCGGDWGSFTRSTGEAFLTLAISTTLNTFIAYSTFVACVLALILKRLRRNVVFELDSLWLPVTQFPYTCLLCVGSWSCSNGEERPCHGCIGAWHAFYHGKRRRGRRWPWNGFIANHPHDFGVSYKRVHLQLQLRLSLASSHTRPCTMLDTNNNNGKGIKEPGALI